MRKIHVEVSKPYDVLIGNGQLDELPDLATTVCTSKRLAIVPDEYDGNVNQ